MCLKKHLFSITEQLFIKWTCEDYKCFSISRHGDKICKIFSCHAPIRDSEVIELGPVSKPNFGIDTGHYHMM